MPTRAPDLTFDLPVEGMTCGSCAARIQRTLAKQPGVTDAEVNFGTGLARLHLDDTAELDQLREAVERAGYTLHVPEPAPSTSQSVLQIDGMTCGSCSARVQRSLQKQPGVLEAQVNFVTGIANVRTDGPVEPAVLAQAIEAAGYRLTSTGSPDTAAAAGERPSGPGAQQRAERAEHQEAHHRRLWGRRLALVALPALLLLSTMLYHDLAMMDSRLRWAQFAIATPVQFYIGWPFLREAGRRARFLTANMDTLIALGTSAAYLFSTWQLAVGGHELYYEAQVVVIAFIVLGRYLEARAKGNAGRAIRSLLELGAKEARVVRHGASSWSPSTRWSWVTWSRSAPARRSPSMARSSRAARRSTSRC